MIIKMKKYYGVLLIEHKHKATTPFGETTINLSWADGMCGVMPVFTNKKLAKKYAGEGVEIIEFTKSQLTLNKRRHYAKRYKER